MSLSKSALSLTKARLHDVAHARAGDKGNRANISLICYHDDAWPHLHRQVTPERVKKLFSHRGATKVERYDLENIHAFNFVIDDVLEGGVNASLNLDGHGKTLSYLLLTLDVEVPAHCLRQARIDTA